MSAAEDEVRVVLITAPDADTGASLARALVGERLAACVNLVPGIRSIYRWEGSIEEGDEVLMVVKTRAARCKALRARVNDLHPYDVPEVIELPIGGGSPAYLEWVRAESRA
jgi:periplasmic divalent cation tolerance protein